MLRFIISVWLLIPALVWGQDSHQLFREANDAYARSEYQHAAELYEQILTRGVQAPELYYNLGNAYYKSNRLGKAILNYERALRLNPADENIHHNLQVASARTVDRIEQRPLLFYERWWRSTRMMFSSTTWAIAGILCFSIFLGLAAAYLFSPTRSVKVSSFWGASVFLLITFFALVFAHKQHNWQRGSGEAVIMVPRVAAKSSPSQQSPDLFLVHEGTRIYLRSSLGEWYEIALPNGNVGWIKKENAEVI